MIPPSSGKIFIDVIANPAWGAALVVYENGKVPNMLSREGVTAVVAVATTRNMLKMAEEEGIIPDAEALWSRITAVIPTANPASNLTLIHPILKP